MPELHSSEDEAARYVLGELTAVERNEFEVRLAESAELRALVRELQEGAVALSMASPRRRAPQEVWKRIERTVSGETRKLTLTALWGGWWRHGWAAAAICVAGWLLYAFWVNGARHSGGASAPIASEINSRRETTLANSRGDETGKAASQNDASNNAAFQSLQARTREVGVLRGQIAELSNRMTRLSQTLAQQQALLSEPGRLKFFQLMPPSASNAGTTNAPVSPELQRALLLAMSRELGWETPGAWPEVAGTGSGPEWRGNAFTPARTNYAGVDFVDLRAASNSAAAPTSQQQTELASTGTSESPSLASASSNAVPGFVSGTNAVLAFDSSVVPSGSLLTFWNSTSWGQFQSLGSATLGNSPLVVRFGVSSWAGGNVTVFAGTPNGTSNFLGQFSTQGTGSP